MNAPTDNNEKLALVTGGAKRIGAILCRFLHHKGYNVISTFHRSSGEAQRLVDELNDQRPNSAWAWRLDLTQSQEIEQIAERLTEHANGLDLLVNNASRYFPTAVGTINEDHWRELIGSNARGALFLCQALQTPLANRQGSIVNLLDADIEHAIVGHTVYAMAKAALAAMTRNLAAELAAQQIRVNAVAPGTILWSRTEQKDAQFKQRQVEHCFLKRTGTPNEIAEAVWWLGVCATYTTGHILYVDGGRHLFMS